MGEWSTLLLNIRVIYRLLGRTEMLVSASFAITFFLTRIVFFGLLVLQLYSQFFQLKKLLSTPLLISYLGLLPAVYGLNWVRAEDSTPMLPPAPLSFFLSVCAVLVHQDCRRHHAGAAGKAGRFGGWLHARRGRAKEEVA